MPEFLPRDTLANGDDDALRCPWCGGDMALASLTLEALHHAHTRPFNGLRWACREADGQAALGALSLDCPTCGKPSIAAFQLIYRDREPVTRLVPVRTAADVAWAAHAAANAVRGPEPS